MKESLTRIERAFSGSSQTREVAALSVLNRKCGFIWLRSASKRARIATDRWSSSITSTRVLFQIFRGIPTQARVESQTQIVTQKWSVVKAKRGEGENLSYRNVLTASSSIIDPNMKARESMRPSRRRIRTERTRLFSGKGEKSHSSPCLRAVRLTMPPSNPHSIVNGTAAHSPLSMPGTPTKNPTDAPGVIPPMRPTRNVPDSERSTPSYPTSTLTAVPAVKSEPKASS